MLSPIGEGAGYFLTFKQLNIVKTELPISTRFWLFFLNVIREEKLLNTLANAQSNKLD